MLVLSLIYTTLVAQEMVSGIVLIASPSSFNGNCSNKFDYNCGNGHCILNSKRCNGFEDCIDGSDEVECEIYNCKEPDWFRCKNQKCISKSFTCDEEDDCGDFSDEINCKSWHRPTIEASQSCPEDEWQCSDRLCIPKEWVCNGEPDCLDSSDESVGCTDGKTVCTQFKCKNGMCISNDWKCDKANDCGDGSDEENCDLQISPADCTANKGFFLCNNEKCIASSRVCDGIADCPDKTDETINCKLSHSNCTVLNCPHKCITTEYGAKCICPDGYHSSSTHDCTDIDECKIYGTCDQKCRNTEGSYECYCESNYMLQTDKRTCKVKEGDAIMLFSSKNEIRGYLLQSELYFLIAKNLKQVIGVTYDGHYVYWTEIFSENESIVRALEDGTRKQVLVTAGLSTPEDLSVDWITGNIYFTDVEMQHIGVCTNDGMYCTVLVNQDVNKPRCIVLNPLDGTMYWSDWGKRPEIARSKMDGTEDISFVSNEIYWPNGIALDRPNQRLYWTDAKLATIESINLDGSGRRIISQGIAKHPYGLAVFENRIYWSDWSTRSIESCDKFTGKNHHTLIKQSHEYIYDIYIYHSTLQSHLHNPCKFARCSDICLLSGNDYSCACPQDKVLDMDKHTCRATTKNQRLIVGSRDALWILKFQELGRHSITDLPTIAQNISTLAYSSLSDILFINDMSSEGILMMDLKNGHTSRLLGESLGHITAMDFDNLGNNLYWCDSQKAIVGVLNLNTMAKKVLLDDMEGEKPTSIALIPEEGIMFVAFKTSKRSTHIDRLHMDGTSRTHVLEGLLGPLHLIYDAQLNRIFWADSGTGTIESTSTDGDDRHFFRSLQSTPIGIAALNKNIFWLNHNSRRLYWATKVNDENSNKRLTIDLPKGLEIMHLISITPGKVSEHACQHNNGNCSHLCLVTVGTAVCTCPAGMKLQTDNKTCFKPKHCELTEFFCPQSDMCIPQNMRCNGHQNCVHGEDEAGCKIHENCTDEHFQCRNMECIKKNLVCDMHRDCKDNSDEENCDLFSFTSCPSSQFMCSNGTCVENRDLCEDQEQCKNGSDGANCKSATCNSKQFRCISGACIPNMWECDEEFDCDDRSDEHNKCDYSTCKPPNFECSNGLCIDSELKCNKVDDCGDSSDEIHCPLENRATDCGPNEFQCYKNKSLCFPIIARCNGTSECPHHEDEQGCFDCHIDEFQCNNKKCIPRQWLCDHVDDCGDESDESTHLCLHEQDSARSAANSSCGTRFHCKNGKCIDMFLVCDGYDNCNDGSDEGGACTAPCIPNNNPCSQICKNTPTGPRCYCNSGYELRGDGRTCTDIKECSIEPPICSQICIEKPGSYQCSCYDGYKLRSDQTTCKNMEDTMSLIFAVSNKIYQLSPTNNTLRVLYSGEIPDITGIDISVNPSFVYFSTEESGTLHRIDILGQVREYISNVGQPQKLAVDWITQNVYFVDGNITSKAIRMCNFESQYCANIIKIEAHNKVSALVIDAFNGYLFYTLSSNWQSFDSPATTIYKCDLDGSNSEKVVKQSNDYITGLTYSIYKQILFYGNQRTGAIYKTKYDGSNQIRIIANLTRPTALAFFDDHLYFYVPNGKMAVCPLFKDYQACRSYKPYGNFNELFAIFHSSRQPTVPNECKDHSCHNLCIPKTKTVECICNSDAVDSAEQQCQKKQVLTANHQSTKSEKVIAHETASANKVHSNTAVIGTAMGMLFVIVVVGVYYYYIKKRPKDVTISMRFQNPIYGCVQENGLDIVPQPGQHEYCNPMNSYSAEVQVTKKVDAKNMF